MGDKYSCAFTKHFHFNSFDLFSSILNYYSPGIIDEENKT